jgi:hypothetical protein
MKSLKMPKGQLEAMNQRRTGNTKAKMILQSISQKIDD